MAEWERDALESKMHALENHCNYMARALTTEEGEEGLVALAWINKGNTFSGYLPSSTLDLIMRSTYFDRDLYYTLVDMVEVDANTAVVMCLDG